MIADGTNVPVCFFDFVLGSTWADVQLVIEFGLLDHAGRLLSAIPESSRLCVVLSVIEAVARRGVVLLMADE